MAQKHEIELSKYQASTGNNLQHYQDLLKMSQDENKRMRDELEMMTQTLRDQEAMSKREVDETQQYQKAMASNYEK